MPATETISRHWPVGHQSINPSEHRLGSWFLPIEMSPFGLPGSIPHPPAMGTRNHTRVLLPPQMPRTGHAFALQTGTREGGHNFWVQLGWSGGSCSLWSWSAPSSTLGPGWLAPQLHWAAMGVRRKPNLAGLCPPTSGSSFASLSALSWGLGRQSWGDSLHSAQGTESRPLQSVLSGWGERGGLDLYLPRAAGPSPMHGDTEETDPCWPSGPPPPPCLSKCYYRGGLWGARLERCPHLCPSQLGAVTPALRRGACWEGEPALSL